MNATTKKKNVKKSALTQTKTADKEEIFYDETGKRISRLGFFFKKMQKKPMAEIVDMRAVLR